MSGQQGSSIRVNKGNIGGAMVGNNVAETTVRATRADGANLAPEEMMPHRFNNGMDAGQMEALRDEMSLVNKDPSGNIYGDRGLGGPRPYKGNMLQRAWARRYNR